MMRQTLFILKTPPPIHGSTIMNKIVADSLDMKDPTNIVFEQSISRNTENIGKVSIRKILKIFTNLVRLINILITKNIGLVYFTLSPVGFAFIKDVLSIIIIKIFNIPLVFHLHGKGIYNQSKVKIFRTLYHYVFKGQYCIVLSDYLKYDIDSFEFKKIFTVGNGIEPVDISDYSVKHSDTFIITYLSNFVKEKGIIQFLEVLSVIKDRGYKVRANIIGGPIDITQEELEETIQKLDISEMINHLGKAYGNRKYKLLAESDLFIFPTYYKNECYPLVLLEAKMFGLPIITSEEGGIRDIIKDGKNGYLVSPMDIISMTDKAELLIRNNKLRKEMKELNLIEFSNKHTVERFVLNLKSVLKEIRIEIQSTKN